MGPAVKPRLEVAFRETRDARHALRISEVIRAIDHEAALEALRSRLSGPLKEQGTTLYLLTSHRAEDVMRGLQQFCALTVFTGRFEQRGDGRVYADSPNADVADVVDQVAGRLQNEFEWQPVKLTLLRVVAERRLHEAYTLIQASLYDASDAVKIYALMQVEAVGLDSARDRVEELQKEGAEAVKAAAKKAAASFR
jgi:hypothetical protein